MQRKVTCGKTYEGLVPVWLKCRLTWLPAEMLAVPVEVQLKPTPVAKPLEHDIAVSDPSTARVVVRVNGNVRLSYPRFTERFDAVQALGNIRDVLD